MSTSLVSSKGQIVLPVALRRRLGMAGMVKAPSRGFPRKLEDFDPASLLPRNARGRG